MKRCTTSCWATLATITVAQQNFLSPSPKTSTYCSFLKAISQISEMPLHKNGILEEANSSSIPLFIVYPLLCFKNAQVKT